MRCFKEKTCSHSFTVWLKCYYCVSEKQKCNQKKTWETCELIIERQFMVGYMWVKLTLHLQKHHLDARVTILVEMVLWHSNISWKWNRTLEGRDTVKSLTNKAQRNWSQPQILQQVVKTTLDIMLYVFVIFLVIHSHEPLKSFNPEI